MRFNGNTTVSGDRKSREFVLISHTKRFNLVLSLYDLGALMGNIPSMMTKHIVVQRSYTALLISLLKLFYASNHTLFMLFCRSNLVPCHHRQS